MNTIRCASLLVFELEHFSLQVLRVLGRTFPTFLNALDNLHEYMMFTYPALKSPSFYCEHESRTGSTKAFCWLTQT